MVFSVGQITLLSFSNLEFATNSQENRKKSLSGSTYPLSQQLKHKSTVGSREARKFTEEAKVGKFTEEAVSALSRPLPTLDWRRAPEVEKVKQ